MQTKTYYASSVPAALEVARKELGEEALLVNSRPASAEARAFGRLEVTFAFENAPPPRPAPPPPARPASELDEIRRQLSALRMAVDGGTRPAAQPREDLGFGYGRLLETGLDPETAREIGQAAARRPGDRAAAFMQEIAGRIPEASFPDMKSGESRTLAFIGPPGRGKTTSLVKIALRFGVAARVPVRIYSAGAHGVGCQEQMARYATILGVPFQAFESVESLGLALDGEGWKGLSLIDTPGLAPADRAENSEFARFFSRRPEIERHLVLRADSRSADMLRVVSRFSALQPSRLLFTGTDEMLSAGAMIEAMIRGRLPAVFAGTGQQIPADLEIVDAARLARSLLEEGALAAVAA